MKNETNYAKQDRSLKSIESKIKQEKPEKKSQTNTGICRYVYIQGKLWSNWNNGELNQKFIKIICFFKN